MSSSARTLLPVGAAVVGVALLVVAVLRVQSSFTQGVSVGPDQVTVECGNAFDARDLDEVNFPDADDFDVLESASATEVSAITAEAADACEDEGAARLLLSSVVGVVGLAGLIAAVVLFRSRSAAA